MRRQATAPASGSVTRLSGGLDLGTVEVAGVVTLRLLMAVLDTTS